MTIVLPRFLVFMTFSLASACACSEPVDSVGGSLVVPDASACVFDASTAGPDAGPGDAGPALGVAQIGIGRLHDPAWITRLGGSADDEAAAVHASATEIYVGGHTASDWFRTSPDPCVACGNHFGDDCGDAFILALDSPTTGVQFGEPQTDSLRAITSDASNVYVAGKSREDAAHGYRNDGWVIAIEQDLDPRLWRSDIQNPNQVDEMLALTIQGTNLYFAGGSTAMLNPPTPTVGQEDAFLGRLTTSGTLPVIAQFGTPAFEEMMAVAADATRVYSVGQTGGSFPGFTNGGSTDGVLVVRNRTLANPVCTAQFGTGGKDVVQAIALVDNGMTNDIYLGGWTEGRITGADCNQDEFVSDALRSDAFVSKYDANCVHQWTRQFGTLNGDLVEGMATDGTFVFVVGDYGAGPDHSHLVSPARGFLRAYDLAGTLVGEVLFDGGHGHRVVARAVAVANDTVYVVGGTDVALGSDPSLGGLDVFVAQIPVADVTSSVFTGTGCP
jgi:hypothetical protein